MAIIQLVNNVLDEWEKKNKVALMAFYWPSEGVYIGCKRTVYWLIHLILVQVLKSLGIKVMALDWLLSALFCGQSAQ